MQKTTPSQVEFEPKVYGSIEKKLLVKLNDEEIQYLDNKENAPQEQQYYLPMDKMRMQVKPPQRYISDDFIAYVLGVTNTNKKIIVVKTQWM